MESEHPTAEGYEYLLESRCGFEQRNLRQNPLNGVYFKSVCQSSVKGVKRFTLEFYLKDYKLSLQVILPPQYPILPPSARLISDRDSVLPDHPDIDQAEGFIEREFESGTWTPKITVRDFVRQIVTMLDDCGAKKVDSVVAQLNAARQVYGYYKEWLPLKVWEYEYLTRKSPKFLNEVRESYCCRLKFYGGEHRAQANRTSLTVEADEISLAIGAHHALQAYLSRAASVHMEEKVAAAAAAKQSIAQSSPKQFTELPGHSLTGLTIRHPEKKCSARNDPPCTGSVPRCASVTGAETAVGTIACRDTHSVVSCPAVLEVGVSTRDSTIVGPPAQSNTTMPSGFGQMHTCVYCFKELPASALEEHQRLYCWRSPKRFETSPVAESRPPIDADSTSNLIDSLADSADRMVNNAFGPLNTAMAKTEAKLGSLEDKYVDCAAKFLCSRRGQLEHEGLKEDLSQAEMQMTCNICLIRQKDTVLRCGHVFCQLCVTDLRERGDRICPVCRADLGVSWQVSWGVPNSPN